MPTISRLLPHFCILCGWRTRARTAHSSPTCTYFLRAAPSFRARARMRYHHTSARTFHTPPHAYHTHLGTTPDMPFHTCGRGPHAGPLLGGRQWPDTACLDSALSSLTPHPSHTATFRFSWISHTLHYHTISLNSSPGFISAASPSSHLSHCHNV